MTNMKSSSATIWAHIRLLPLLPSPDGAKSTAATDPHVRLEVALVHPEQVAVGPVDGPRLAVRV